MVIITALLICQTLLPAETSWAQETDQPNPPTQPQPKQTQKSPEPAQTAPSEGGPGLNNGPIALPKRMETPPPPPPPPPKTIKNPPGLGNLSMSVNVPVVNVDVGVMTEKTHQFIPNLQEDNFRVFENGAPQKIIAFHQVKAPITAVLLLEFAQDSWWFIQDMWDAAWSFTNQLEPQDYVAVVTYDMHTHILTDFTHNKSVIQNAVQSLQMPTWSEANEFDALYEVLDRLSRVHGRKYVILVSSGIDTFSRITLDQMLKKIKETPNVTIFTITTGGYVRAMTDSSYGPFAGQPGMTGMGGSRIALLQADNEMQTFARMTGGLWFKPRFQAEFPEIFQQINDSIRNQYQLTYRPTDRKLDGTYRRIRVELVDAEGRPLRMVNQKHKPVKYLVIARDGYRAAQTVQ